ncbi:hypothetical protein [Pseudomarimonas salicorniae]|uniref:Uncharacterized protein n=1 Tax=Pseudomarimonas salicorniae TaxID=2933270 RepID=A0ABT0GGN9_9GAMM|nr:hypothetical protein [Lysobacter sp. CAU 1642]MCK7593701.1 hypothetical protein [Lysobacter sp. CAU 1642]
MTDSHAVRRSSPRFLSSALQEGVSNMPDTIETFMATIQALRADSVRVSRRFALMQNEMSDLREALTHMVEDLKQESVNIEDIVCDCRFLLAKARQGAESSGAVAWGQSLQCVESRIDEISYRSSMIYGYLLSVESRLDFPRKGNALSPERGA